MSDQGPQTGDTVDIGGVGFTAIGPDPGTDRVYGWSPQIDIVLDFTAGTMRITSDSRVSVGVKAAFPSGTRVHYGIVGFDPKLRDEALHAQDGWVYERDENGRCFTVLPISEPPD